MSKKRIMIVEDEYLVLMGIKTMVEQLGHVVVAEAPDGLIAFDLAIEKNPDIILMDINIPKMNGIETCKKIQEIISIPIIFITGYSDKGLIQKAKNIGVLAYLIKPVSKKDLEPAIEIAVSRHQEIVKLREEVQRTKDLIETRKTIEMAKGIIMKRKNMDEEKAYKWMQRQSCNNNIKIETLAERIIEYYRIISLET